MSQRPRSWKLETLSWLMSKAMGPGGYHPSGPSTIGTSNNTQPRIRSTRSRLTDRVSPIELTAEPGPSSNPETDFPCGFPGCDRVFKSLNGKGVHENYAHPDWYESVKLKKSHTKERWNVEELDLMARKEAELLIASGGKVKMINIELHKIMRNRTHDSIKSARRRKDYQNKVTEFINILNQRGEQSSRENLEQIPNNIQEEKWAEYITSMEIFDQDGKFKQFHLNDICSMLGKRSRNEIFIELELYLRELFPEIQKPKSSRQTKNSNNIGSNKKKQRREEYAKVQDLWRKNPSDCTRRILDNKLVQGNSIPKEVMVPFWEALMEIDKGTGLSLTPKIEKLEHLWFPITLAEVKTAFPPMNTATGPDGLDVKSLREVPCQILAKVFNVIMWTGRIPEYLTRSRTVLIPKKNDATDPSDFRPITVSSVLTRTFHKVLANRLKSVDLDQRQRAFREVDGCSENIMLLDLAIKYHREQKKKIFIAVLDMKKAFDSVTFETLYVILKAKGIPDAMIKYILQVYYTSKTKLQHGGWESDWIQPKCGVKQGDPLSPIIFNFVIDEMLKDLPSEVGVEIEGLKLNVLAFADDLVLMAATETGLQELLNKTIDFLENCGLEPNINKCATIAIRTIPNEKRTAIDSTCSFKIKNTRVPALRRSDEWKYLGVKFSPHGRITASAKEKLENYLEVITKAPLKPQQRLWALRVVIIPRLLYDLTMSTTTFGYLRSIDRKIRSYVRRWLHLPHESPNAYIHANIKDGGLGIHSIRWKAPAERLSRLTNLLTSECTQGVEAENYVQKEIRIVKQRVTCGRELLSTSKAIDSFWAECLYRSVDGAPLKDARCVPKQNNWIGNCTKFLSGRDYINSCRLRINAFPTRSRTARGRIKERSCRAGCMAVETLNHVVQHCHRTHNARMKRHDAICNYIAKKLRKNEYEVILEPHFTTSTGLKKPDIVATRGKTSFIIDAQVIGEQRDRDKANEDKIRKYQDNEDLQEQVKNRYGSDTVITMAATCSSRGLWSLISVNDMLEKGILGMGDINILSSRVIIGGIYAWNVFNQTTSVERTARREGIG